jgi:hypothetical protein
MPSGHALILALKGAVVAVTVLHVMSLIALARGRNRLHGQMNTVFFTLTMAAVVLFELAVRVGPIIEPGWSVTSGWAEQHHNALRVHLCFVIPLVIVLPAMLVTGRRGPRAWHLWLAGVFSILWTGMFITGVFFLPHAP